MRFFYLMTSILLVCAACSNAKEKIAEKATEKVLEKALGVEKVDINLKDKTISATKKDGTKAIQSGGKEVPDGFPYPVLDGAEIAGSLIMQNPITNKPILQLQLDSKKTKDEIIKFYESQIASKGGTTAVNPGKSGALMMKVTHKDAAMNGMIAISARTDGTHRIILTSGVPTPGSK